MKCGTCKTTVSKPDPWNEKSGDCDEWVLDGDNLSWSIWPLEWKLEDNENWDYLVWKELGDVGKTDLIIKQKILSIFNINFK